MVAPKTLVLKGEKSILFFTAVLVFILSCGPVYIPPGHYFNTLSQGKSVEIRAESLISIPSVTITVKRGENFFFGTAEASSVELAYRFGAGAGKIIQSSAQNKESDKWSPKTMKLVSISAYIFRLRHIMLKEVYIDGESKIVKETLFIDGVDAMATYNFIFTSRFFDSYAGVNILFVAPFGTTPFLDSSVSTGIGVGYKEFKITLRTSFIWTPLILSLVVDEYYPKIGNIGTLIPLFLTLYVGAKLTI